MFQFIPEVFSVSKVRFHPCITMSSLGSLCALGTLWCWNRLRPSISSQGKLLTNVFVEEPFFTNLYYDFSFVDWYRVYDPRYDVSYLLLWCSSVKWFGIPSSCYVRPNHSQYLLKYKQKYGLSLLRVRQDRSLPFLLRQNTTKKCTQPQFCSYSFTALIYCICNISQTTPHYKADYYMNITYIQYIYKLENPDILETL